MFEFEKREQSPAPIEALSYKSDAVELRDVQVEKELKALFPADLLPQIIPIFQLFERLGEDKKTFLWYVARRYGWGEGVMSEQERKDWHSWDTKLYKVGTLVERN